MPWSKAMGIYYGSHPPNIFESMPLIHFGLSERWGSESSYWPPLAILGYIPLGFAVIAFLITFHPDSLSVACLIPQLGYGGVIFIGSQNPFFNDVVTDAMVITFLSAVMFVLQGYVFTIMKDSFILEVAHGDHMQFEKF
ncbi:unnamed protein product [Nippostrongylus brasiliensis]|uniref:Sulfate_transp domain-containing protein n=1 Tax=Nippostrongylus brasiliensis TaxID=27835 RepID=A0A0N4XGD9_NIPBR|nr:unnamed protein product [Nippostrongylus brasiliensis]